MISIGNGFWLNEEFITNICDISLAKKTLDNLKSKKLEWRIINTSGTRAAKSCIYTNKNILILTPFTASNIQKKFENIISTPALLKCGNGNFVITKNSLLVIPANKNIGGKIYKICSINGHSYDFTQNKGTNSYILTNDFNCFKASMNSNTIVGFGRKIREKSQKNKDYSEE